MNDDGFAFLFGMALGFIMACSAVGAFNATYKDGQTDALSGIIKYEMITNANQTVEWVKIDR